MKTSRTNGFRWIESLEQKVLFAVISLESFGTDPGDARDAQLMGTWDSGNSADRYTLDLDAGDIIDADVLLPNASWLASVKLLNSSGTQLIGPGSFGIVLDFDQQFPLPSSSPLIDGIQNSSIAYVIPASGIYHIDVSPPAGQYGTYELSLQAYRPVMESRPLGAVQKFFLDFDGATINPSQIFGQGKNSNVAVSALSSFLTNWSLTSSDLNSAINAIQSTVVENLKTDIESQFSTSGVQILNSRDHGEQWGQADVTRVIVGGTLQQTELVDVIGLAQSLDVGNFATAETAIVHLDVLSATTGAGSINSVQSGGGAAKIQAVGRVVGNIVSHELGHLLGNMHTESNGTLNLMDTPTIAALNADVDFGNDAFSQIFLSGSSSTIIAGQQDSLKRSALSVPKGLNVANPYIHSVIVYSGGSGNESLTVGSQGVGKINITGPVNKSFSNVSQFVFYGNGGNDSLFASGANVPIMASGGAGNDTLHGSAFNDILRGDDGVDTLFGYGGNDQLEGGAGQDWLDGGAGNDKLYGYLASALVADGLTDYLIGGSGTDECWYDNADVLQTVEILHLV